MEWWSRNGYCEFDLPSSIYQFVPYLSLHSTQHDGRPPRHGVQLSRCAWSEWNACSVDRNTDTFSRCSMCVVHMYSTEVQEQRIAEAEVQGQRRIELGADRRSMKHSGHLIPDVRKIAWGIAESLEKDE